MLNLKFLRAILLMSAAGLAVLAPSAGALARSRREPVAEAPPPPAPVPPAGLSDRLIGDAAAYQGYVERVAATSAAFASGDEVAAALRTSAAFEPRALVRGAIAYGAVAALGGASFVASVRAAATSPDNRRLIAGYLLADPNYAVSFAGSDAAAGLAKQALLASGARLTDTGRLMKASAYSVQHQAWSKGPVLDPRGRLDAVEAAASNGLTPAPDHMAGLRNAAAGGAPTASAPAGPELPPYGPLVAHALQLAAIAALGEATDDAYDRLTPVMADGDVEGRLHLARLNLNQCLAVARPHYEDIFCMGQHAIADTGESLTKGAIFEVAPPPVIHLAPAEKPKPKVKPSTRSAHRRHR